MKVNFTTEQAMKAHRRSRGIIQLFLQPKYFVQKILPDIVRQCISYLRLKGGYDSLRREVCCNVLTEVVISMGLVKLTEMCLNRNCSTVQLSKLLSDI
jgi:hypothetical protein